MSKVPPAISNSSSIAAVKTSEGSPEPIGTRLVPVHRAMQFAICPPARRKAPPTITSPAPEESE